MNNFFESFPYLRQMNDQFRQIFGDDFMRNLMQSMQSQNWMNGQQMNPFTGMPGMEGQDRLNRQQNQQTNTSDGNAGAPPGGPMWNPFFGQQAASPNGAGVFPMADILETKHELILVMEIPGLERASDVRISVYPEQVTVKGDIQRAKGRNHEFSVLQSERRIGKFERTFSLPVRVRKQHAKAIYQQGLLEIRLLKEGKLQENDAAVIDIDFT